MNYFSTDLEGVTLIEPDASQMRQILESARDAQEDYPEVFLTHPAGTTVSYRCGGILVLEVEGEVAGILSGVTVEAALDAWQLVASGKLEELDKLPWSQPPEQ